MVKETSPEATAFVCAASGVARMYRARKPDQGQRTSLCSKLRLSSLPASFVGVKMGSSSKVPVRRPSHSSQDTQNSQTSYAGLILLDWVMCGQTVSERPGNNMHGTPQRSASHKAGRAKPGPGVAHSGQHSGIKDEESSNWTHL